MRALRRRVQIQAAARFHDLPRQLALHDLAEMTRGGEQLREIDASVVAHRFQHMHEVFGADVTGRPRRKRAAAQPT